MGRHNIMCRECLDQSELKGSPQNNELRACLIYSNQWGGERSRVVAVC